MSNDVLLEIPDELYAWLVAEAARCKMTLDELIIDIIETRMLFSGGMQSERVLQARHPHH